MWRAKVGFRFPESIAAKASKVTFLEAVLFASFGWILSIKLVIISYFISIKTNVGETKNKGIKVTFSLKTF